ncbi:MAG: glucosamine-6-phosphate deaminase [Verrucomicrobia bacterium]|jgi:glucosamine-6-phosphate deaminase|nr:glucosamine-6-phosphate deaminase [Verrucomicrobiota bacterium]MBT7069118.1 glucosamine-6-phosphate deaminase [Verrucomicrobiota bacterium]MBT7699464.1 glucosamine-6-phosphate deaminase [Verrucomicrobiota bacterium]
MEVIIRPDPTAATQLAAALIADQVRTKPSSVLGLATGATMERLYAELVRQHKEEGLDFSLVRTFNLDEYVGLSPEDPHSYRHYMNAQLFNHINIDIRNTHLPHGQAEDLKLECRRYEALMQACGGVDLQLLGIGRSGHIGFNEPLSALQSRTRDKALTPTTIEQNEGYFPTPADMPRCGITMGVGTILEARDIVMLVTGSSKAAVIAKAVEGPITSMISASALQMHPHCRTIVDEAAATDLTQQEYYHWIFENEDEWRAYR